MDQGVSGWSVSCLELHGERSAMVAFQSDILAREFQSGPLEIRDLRHVARPDLLMCTTAPLWRILVEAHLKQPEDAPWKA